MTGGIAVCCFLFFSARWYIKIYGDIGFDSIIYTLGFYFGGVKPGLVMEFIRDTLLPTLICTVASGLFLFLKTPRLSVGPLCIYPLGKYSALAASLMICLALLVNAAEIVGLKEYIRNHLEQSAIFESSYVFPDSVEIKFPEKKRNLIYIFMESMEVTYLSEGEGGGEQVNLIPELQILAEENINFSSSSGVGGFRPVGGTTWTIGAMVGQTAGVPLKTPENLDDFQNGYGADGVFLPGLTTLSDILFENGYYQMLMVGSDAFFGGREAYYTSHHTDEVLDLYDAREAGIVSEDYYVWWGMEDKYLYEFAKGELLKLGSEDRPFAFSMLTVDTHHVAGYVCELCGNDHTEQYENVISCASRQLMDFISWIQAQAFYENTTIVICGDHPSMDADYFARNVASSYVRRCYNCFINSAAETQCSKNREFTTLDLFPTVLSAMGCSIEGERLGLGTNLFSGVPTLAEELGFENFNAQIGMASEYYAVEFRQEDQTEQ